MNTDIEKIKLFPYFGGKFHLIDDIMREMIRIIEKHNIKCVVDVFGGSGKVILSLPLKYKVNRIYNDIDRRLTTTIKLLMDKEKREKIIDSLEFAIRSRDLFNEYVNSDWNNLSDEEVSLRFLYITSYSYSSNFTTYGYLKNAFNNHIYATIDNIKNNWKYVVQLTNIENLDYRVLIKKYAGDKTLFYLDPPYPTAGKTYKYSFSDEDFKNLKNVLDENHAKYILNISKNDFDFIIPIFGNYTFAKEYKNSVNNEGKRLEGFWINEYDLENNNLTVKEMIKNENNNEIRWW